MNRYFMNLHLFDEGGDGSQGNAGGTGSGAQGQGSAATFTYAQLDDIARARSERAERSAVQNYLQQQGLSDEEARQAFAEWKKSKDSQKPDISKIEKERDDARNELQQIKNTNILRDLGVRAEDLDYVTFKVQKLVDDKTDFKKAAEKFLGDNKRYTTKGSYRVSSSSGSTNEGASNNTHNSINDAIRNRARR